MLLTERLKAQTKDYLLVEQAGYRKDKSSVQKILALRVIAKRQGGRIKGYFSDILKHSTLDSISKSAT